MGSRGLRWKVCSVELVAAKSQEAPENDPVGTPAGTPNEAQDETACVGTVGTHGTLGQTEGCHSCSLVQVGSLFSFVVRQISYICSYPDEKDMALCSVAGTTQSYPRTPSDAQPHFSRVHVPTSWQFDPKRACDMPMLTTGLGVDFATHTPPEVMSSDNTSLMIFPSCLREKT